MSVTVEIVGQDAVMLRLKGMTDEVRGALRRGVLEAAIDVEQRVKQKLAGEVLQERTHHLHDSIHHTMVEDSATAIVAAVGTDVVYAAYHEYGFHGVQQVREHMRHVAEAFGRPIEPVEALVRAHARRVDYSGHPFLHPTLVEMAPQIQARLEAAVGEAVRP